MTVNTAKARHRDLRFRSLDEALAEAERLAAAPRVVMHGNWSLGQVCGHLANALHMSIDGPKFRAPWYVRFVGPLLKGRFLSKMPAGFKLPPAAAEQLVAGEQIDTPAGLAALRAAVARFRENSHREPHPVIGRLTLDEWNRLHQRHCELHLGFAEAEE